MNWPQKPLSKVATIDRNSVQPDDIASGSTYLGLEHIKSGGKILTRPVVENGELKSSKFRFTSSHILYGKLRPYLGKITCPDFDGVCSTDILPVLPNKDMDRRYVCYYLQQPHIVDLANSKSTGANLPRLSPMALSQIPLPVPPLSEQKRIAEILDRAEALRAKRRAALALLDELTQSIFLDMFGDPAVNPKGFPIATLSEFYANPREGTKCGPFGSALKKHEYVDAGVPVWNMDNIDADGRLSLPFRMWITESKFRKLAAYSVEDGDIIISRAGTVGKMCVTNLGAQQSLISTNLIRLRLGAKLLPIYFVSLMTYCKGRIGRLKTGPDGAFTHMNTKILDNLKFPYPPIELQRRFSDALNSTDEHKAILQSQLLELDQLFASLQHRAFRGELSSRKTSASDEQL